MSTLGDEVKQKAIVLLKGVYLKSPEYNILSNLNISFPANKTTLILGENGSGKTSLIDVITQNVKPSKGTVEFNYLKKGTGVLFDSTPYNPNLKVRELIKYFSLLYDVNRKTTTEYYIDLLKLNEVVSKKFNVLSLGEKKRVGLLFAIFHNPTFIILDEPFGGIDPNSLNTITSLINKVNGTKIVTTHHWMLAEKLADFICFLFKGKLLCELESPTRLLSNNYIPSKRKVVIDGWHKADIYKTGRRDEFGIILEYDHAVHMFYKKVAPPSFINRLDVPYSIKNKSLNDVYYYLIEMRNEMD